jgi:hypothetical protein
VGKKELKVISEKWKYINLCIINLKNLILKNTEKTKTTKLYFDVKERAKT